MSQFQTGADHQLQADRFDNLMRGGRDATILTMDGELTRFLQYSSQQRLHQPSATASTCRRHAVAARQRWTSRRSTEEHLEPNHMNLFFVLRSRCETRRGQPMVFVRSPIRSLELGRRSQVQGAESGLGRSVGSLVISSLSE